MLGICSIDGFCDLLHEVSTACSRNQASAIAAGGLAVAEFHALQEISRTPRPRLESLAERLSVSRGRLTHILDALEKKELVTRRRHEDDHRNVVLEMTHEGKRVLARATRMRDEVGGALMSRMEDEERDRLIESLELLKRLMTEMEEKGPAKTRGASSRGRPNRKTGRTR